MLNVAAIVANMTCELADLAYNSVTKELAYSSVPLSRNYWKQLTIQVSLAAGATSFSGMLGGNVRLEGFLGTIVDVDDQRSRYDVFNSYAVLII